MSIPDSSNIPPQETFSLQIEKISIAGAGLGYKDEKPVYVSGALPGQTVLVRPTKETENRIEGRVVKVEKPSIHESNSRSVLPIGGGWGKLPYDKQISYKEDIVRETLQALTPVSDDEKKNLPGRVLRIAPSPQIHYYRNALNLSFGLRDGKPSIGLPIPMKEGEVLPVGECELYDEQLPALIADVQRFMERMHLPIFHPKNRRGMLRSLMLRRGIATGESQIALTMNARKKDLEPLFQHILQLAGRPGLASLLVIEHTGMGDISEHGKIHCLTGKPTITERLFDLSFELSPFTPFPVNTQGAEKLYQAVVEGAGCAPRDTVLSAYSGSGILGQYLARFCEKVVCVEQNASAVDEALHSAGKNKIGNISFYKGRVDHVLDSQLKPGGKYTFNTIVLEPPRGGIHKSVRDAALSHKPHRFVYVSSSIVSFARDLGDFLKAGYDLRTVQPVDLHPHTPHVQVVGVLEKS